MKRIRNRAIVAARRHELLCEINDALLEFPDVPRYVLVTEMRAWPQASAYELAERLHHHIVRHAKRSAFERTAIGRVVKFFRCALSRVRRVFMLSRS